MLFSCKIRAIFVEMKYFDKWGYEKYNVIGINDEKNIIYRIE